MTLSSSRSCTNVMASENIMIEDTQRRGVFASTILTVTTVKADGIHYELLVLSVHDDDNLTVLVYGTRTDLRCRPRSMRTPRKHGQRRNSTAV